MIFHNRVGFAKSLLRLFSFFLAILPSLAHAIVNMESVHLGKPEQGFSGNFDLSIDAQYGNTEKSTASTGMKLQWAEDKNTDFVLASYSYGESGGVKDTNKSFVHLRHIHQIDDSIAWEAFTQLSSNEFTRLNLRALLGGGARLTLGKISDKHAIYLGLGGFYEREELDVETSGSDTKIEKTFRGNGYLVMKYQFNPYVTMVSATYYQPALDEFSDYRAIENASLVSQLTDELSLQLAVDIQHDSKPAPDVKKTDTSVTVGFSLRF
jgi:putative salt-induced outer membrane protein YdiY